MRKRDEQLRRIAPNFGGGSGHRRGPQKTVGPPTILSVLYPDRFVGLGGVRRGPTPPPPTDLSGPRRPGNLRVVGGLRQHLNRITRIRPRYRFFFGVFGLLSAYRESHTPTYGSLATAHLRLRLCRHPDYAFGARSDGGKAAHPTEKQTDTTVRGPLDRPTLQRK